MRVFVSRKIPAAGPNRLREAGLEVTANPEDRALSPPELREGCRDCDGLLCLLTDRIDREFLAAAGHLRGIALMAVGYDNIDLASCSRLGIPVSNTPGVLTDATADLAFALLLAAARRIPEADRYLREGRFRGWSPTLLLGEAVAGSTLGIVGAGRIGSATARRGWGFGMTVIYSSRRANPKLERETGAKRLPLAELLEQADFVSLHVPLSPQTRHLIDAATL